MQNSERDPIEGIARNPPLAIDGEGVEHARGTPWAALAERRADATGAVA